MTETNLINLRRTIYLTIMNSLGFEEATHKLLKVDVPEGHEVRKAVEFHGFRQCALRTILYTNRLSYVTWSSSVAPKKEPIPLSTVSSESVCAR
jgi:hypothetical protein